VKARGLTHYVFTRKIVAALLKQINQYLRKRISGVDVDLGWLGCGIVPLLPSEVLSDTGIIGPPRVRLVFPKIGLK
jgi:hypothetical protein